MGRQGKRQREHPPSPGARKGHPGGTDHPGSPREGEQEQGKKCEPGEGLREPQSSLGEGEALRTRVLKVQKNLLLRRK